MDLLHSHPSDSV